MKEELTKLKTGNDHIVRPIYSTIDIEGIPETIWDNIVNVKIEQYAEPFVFRIFGIPKPLWAQLLADGLGGKRIAYFDNGKIFLQEITLWNPLKQFSFDYNPEKGFVVGHFFDLSSGMFRVSNGSYQLTPGETGTTLKLLTTYSLDKRVYLLFNLPVRLILKLFQRYLLRSIKKNSE